MHDHLFASDDGSLYDTRRPNWAQCPLRTDYRKTFSRITCGRELRATLRAGGYAWPGGYPLYFLCADGSSLSFDYVREHIGNCTYEIRYESNARIVACEINYEDAHLYCDGSNERIPSAYAEN